MDYCPAIAGGTPVSSRITFLDKSISLHGWDSLILTTSPPRGIMGLDLCPNWKWLEPRTCLCIWLEKNTCWRWFWCSLTKRLASGTAPCFWYPKSQVMLYFTLILRVSVDGVVLPMELYMAPLQDGCHRMAFLMVITSLATTFCCCQKILDRTKVCIKTG